MILFLSLIFKVYGNAQNFPVPEDTPHRPANVYGESKAKAEDVIQHHIKSVTADGSKKINAILLRLSNVYGSSADHRERLIPAIMSNALSHRPIQIVGGGQDLDMVNVADVVNAIALAVNRLTAAAHASDPKWGNIEIFNIGTDHSTPAMELIRKILWLTNSSSPLQMLPGDDRFPDKYIGRTSHAADVLGFKAKVSIDEGLHRLAAQYLGETKTYLRKKQEAECNQHPNYSNKDLLFLDGCSGTLAADLEGQPFYAYFDSHMSWGDPNRPDINPGFGWRDEDEPQPWDFSVKKSSKGAVIRFTRLAQDKKDDKVEKSYHVSFEVPEKGAMINKETQFLAKVDPMTGYVSLQLEKSGFPLVPWDPKPPPGGGENDPVPDPEKTALGAFRFRLTPFCCPGKASPWPFFRDDPLASAILDDRLEQHRRFNASQIITLCKRLEDAEHLVQQRLDKLASDPRPVKLEEAPLPTGKPHDWRFRNLDVCTNLCDHPTVCLDTGDCACGQASCIPRKRFPFSDYANLPYLSYPPPKLSLNWGEIEGVDPAALSGLVEKSTWLNVLRPGARRYLARNPNFPAINVTRLPDDVEKARADDPEKYDKVQTEWHGCYSADSVMERGAKLLSHDYAANNLVFLPHWSYTLRFPPVGEWVNNAVEHNLPSGFDTSDMIVPFTFDWGRCQTILHNLYRVRDWSKSVDECKRSSAWQPMGDINSPCYFMDQDVVIPARTCLQEELRKEFGNIADVKPARMRTTFVTFKGSPNGAGSSVRQKLVCDRPYKKIRGKLTGANDLVSYWGKLKPASRGASDASKPAKQYMDTIGDAIFCPLPRGTTGWATRTTDVIYAGCIPVLLGDQTHHPFWDMLDWAKFSIQINDYDIENLESILLSYTWEDIERMQTNLMLVREAFLYPAEGNMDANLHERVPFFFAMHSAYLLQQTKFPT